MKTCFRVYLNCYEPETVLGEFETVAGYQTLFEDVTMATDETTILEIKATIALHSDFKFDKVSPEIKATGNLPKNVLHVPCSTF